MKDFAVQEQRSWCGFDLHALRAITSSCPLQHQAWFGLERPRNSRKKHHTEQMPFFGLGPSL
ncbi:MAG TPA: hypothetical protein PLJ50_14650, partial [Candidatus Latescibacteria bacterium]|nr:hypothetical protein [Candidatus Latescibacterota bacterium]